MGSRSAWQAVRVRPRFENIAAANLTQKGFEVFLPPRTTPHTGSGRKRETTQLLFPGYLFCRMSSAGMPAVLTAPGVLHLVGTGSITSCRVDEMELAALRIIVQSAQHYEVAGPFIYSGPKIRVNNGPLRNLEGVLVKPKRRSRIAVSLSLLRRSILVDLPGSTQFTLIPGEEMPPMPVPA